MASTSSVPRRSRQTTIDVRHYNVERQIGKGSFATVYRGEHRSTRLLVAIKAVDVGKLKGKVKDNLYSEIKILEKLHHPHIVALHECIETPTHIHLIMEFCSLGDLSQFIKGKHEEWQKKALHDVLARYPMTRGGGVHEVLIRHFLKQLASALQFLRSKALIHRDVKPQNLLLLPSPAWTKSHPQYEPILGASHDSLIPATGVNTLPMLKIADFGFARVLPSTTLAETLCGSPLYMAPEILGYEHYDAKADLWSVGTVLYEMATGRPPFKAQNHVDLLRVIKKIDDNLEFPSRVRISHGMRDVTLSLLKRGPADRISFENFFNHEVVTGPIPGLLLDDMAASIQSTDSKSAKGDTKAEDPDVTTQKSVPRRTGTAPDVNRSDRGQQPDRVQSPLEKPYRRSPLSTPTSESDRQLGQPATRLSNSPRQEMGEGLGIRRPQPTPSSSAPARSNVQEARRRAISNASANKYGRETSTAGLGESPRSRMAAQLARTRSDERDQVQQDIDFEREYVVVDRNQIQVNILADDMAANGRRNEPAHRHSLPSNQMVRRTTTQGIPGSPTGAAPAPSRTMQITLGRPRANTYERRPSLGSKPASFITKAIHGASNRWLGVKLPTDFGKGSSPPALYDAFSTSMSPTPTALIGDGRQNIPYEEGARVAQAVEDFATRSDVVYGFAEVKYRQLVPIAPSMELCLGGVPADAEAAGVDPDLTPEAVVSLSEEALLLYVKTLSLLAKAIDISNLWWTRKARSESSSSIVGIVARNSAHTQAHIDRISSIVQWIRGRFNEILEKTEVVRLKLIQAQKTLPEEHPNHPNNWSEAETNTVLGVTVPYITPGLTAEKLMYERAVEMSRKAAIDEVSSMNLEGCELAYITAHRMLEAVLDKDDDAPKRRISGASNDDSTTSRDETESDHVWEDQERVNGLITMLGTRLKHTRAKIQAAKSLPRMQKQQRLDRRLSRDEAPRSPVVSD